MKLPLQFFVHPRSPAVAEKLTALLSAHGVSTSSLCVKVLSIEVDFTKYTPAYLVPEAMLNEVSAQPYATEVFVFYEAPGQRVRRLCGTAAKVTKRSLVIE